jgi:hypothetical protein
VVSALQRPDATRVAGFWAWKNLGRVVKSGEKGIRILAPIVGVKRKKDKRTACAAYLETAIGQGLVRLAKALS